MPNCSSSRNRLLETDVRTVIAISALTVAGVVAFAQLTDGFRVVTSESARRLAAVENPALMPDAVLVDSLGSVQSLRADLASDGRVAVVDFIYTRCESICTALGSEFQQLQRQIQAQGLQHQIRLISISFDPARDQPGALAEYAMRIRAEPDVWRFATVADAAQLGPLLRGFGVIVIPAGQGDFVHNAAIHIVTPSGKLVRIRDPGAIATVLRDAIGTVQ